MKYLVNQKIMQELDAASIQTFQIPSMVLMERAAYACVEQMISRDLVKQGVLVVCGSGNNGGDGFAIARILHLKGYAVTVCFVGKKESRTIDCKHQMEIVEKLQIPIVDELPLSTEACIVDAVFGNGLNREIKGSYADIIEQMSRYQGAKLSVDVPSGISGDSGKVLGTAFRADYTITFQYEKVGTVLFPGAAYAGKVLVADIGIVPPKEGQNSHFAFTFDLSDLKNRMPKRISNSHKGTYGKVLLVAGSREMCGAAYLAAKASYLVGAGLVKIFTEKSNQQVLQTLIPEAIVVCYEADKAKEALSLLQEQMEWATVIGAGSGLGLSDTSKELVERLLFDYSGKLVLDGDALTMLSEHMEWLYKSKSQIILTPHKKELSRLLHLGVEEINEQIFSVLDTFVQNQSFVCVAKDARTIVATDREPYYINTTGNSSMAKGGSGDVLMGTITGLLAQGLACSEAAITGVLLHGIGGDAARDTQGEYSVLASDILDGIKQVLTGNRC